MYNPKHSLRNRLHAYLALYLLLLGMLVSSCERDARLKIEGGNPPIFKVLGKGSLKSISISGPDIKHQSNRTSGDESRCTSIYWEIRTREEDDFRDKGQPRQITYGATPEGYTQVYPEEGTTPLPLIEGKLYCAKLTVDGVNKGYTLFTIHQGKAVAESD